MIRISTAAQSSPDSERFHFMDPMRGVLMMLGVVLHSAQIFNPERNWLIYSEHNIALARYLVDSIHVFRMPAFFTVSGFFCLLTLRKYGPLPFLRKRLVRIGVPLIVTAITLNSLQTVMTSVTGWYSFSWHDYIVNGVYVYHLWFLINLIVYFIAAAMLLELAGPAARGLVRAAARLVLALPMALVLLIVPFTQLATLALAKLGFPLYTKPFGIFDTFSIIGHLPYFIFGALLAARPELLRAFSKFNPILSLAGIIICALLLRYVALGDGLPALAFGEYLRELMRWLATSICFFIFYTYLKSASKRGRFLADASYTVYLFHQVLVVFIGLVLIELGLSAWIALPLLIVVVATITFWIHVAVISRSRILRFLFNGRS